MVIVAHPLRPHASNEKAALVRRENPSDPGSEIGIPFAAAPRREDVMRYLAGLVLALALSVMGCSETTGTGGSAGDGGSGGDGGAAGGGGAGGGGGKPPEIVAAEQAALEALTGFIEAFNEVCEDGGEAYAKTFNYPHARVGAFNQSRVWETEQEFIDSPDVTCDDIIVQTPSWDYSEFDSIKIVQSSPRKVHITLVSGRFDAEGNRIPAFERWNALYIMSENDGRWGTLGRSSWAPFYYTEAPEAEAAALEALAEYIEAFNEICEDGGEAWARTLNYPHVHFDADGQVEVWETEQELIDSMSCEAILSLTPDWDYSEFGSIEIVQRGPAKVHITLVATQYDAAGEALGSFETFFIMTDKGGHWGTQARSSYTPL
jgi:hypothetical protein